MLDIFFFNDTATTEIYTLSLHDALPILRRKCWGIPTVKINGVDANPPRWPDGSHSVQGAAAALGVTPQTVFKWLRKGRLAGRDRKSTRLNSSHANISYAVFCLKKKKPCS